MERNGPNVSPSIQLGGDGVLVKVRLQRYEAMSADVSEPTRTAGLGPSATAEAIVINVSSSVVVVRVVVMVFQFDTSTDIESINYIPPQGAAHVLILRAAIVSDTTFFFTRSFSSPFLISRLSPFSGTTKPVVDGRHDRVDLGV